MRKELIMILFVLALLFICFAVSTAPDVICGDEVVLSEMDAMESEVTVLKEPLVEMDIDISEATAVSRFDEQIEIENESNPNYSNSKMILTQSERLCNCCSSDMVIVSGRYSGDNST